MTKNFTSQIPESDTDDYREVETYIADLRAKRELYDAALDGLVKRADEAVAEFEAADAAMEATLATIDQEVAEEAVRMIEEEAGALAELEDELDADDEEDDKAEEDDAKDPETWDGNEEE